VLSGVGPRLVSVEIRGFRAFGTEARQLDLDAPISVVHAGNSQGKTSLAEALEFLISGASSRRELLGGAKAEYNNSLCSAHLPFGDDVVYVEAVLRGSDGTTHRVRRELMCDFGRGEECESRLLIDGCPATDLTGVGVPIADPPIRAPVLLQHTLRHVLSTEPKQRVGYFKALLSLTDLDRLRERVAVARKKLDGEVPGAALRAVDRLAGTPAAPAVSTITALAEDADDAAAVAVGVEPALIDAGTALLGTRSSSFDELTALVSAAIETHREQTFPLSAFASGGSVPAAPTVPVLDSYTVALAAADHQAARLAPVLTAVLSVDEYTSLDHPVDCPVCATPLALTPERMAVLRDRLRATAAVDRTAGDVARAITDARRDVDRLIDGVRAVVPPAASWTAEQLAEATGRLRELGIDDSLAAAAQASSARVAADAEVVNARARGAREALNQVAEAVATRDEPQGDMASSYRELEAALAQLGTAVEDHQGHGNELRAAVEPAIRERASMGGLAELADLLARRDELTVDIVTAAGVRRAAKRLSKAERALRTAAGRVLDARFDKMSDTISAWWTSIRPEELVGFGGVKRRAGGALFVNLVAALRADSAGAPVERDALGVYSDSQLNALGLSIFLARAELLGSPIVILDDPIPGSDADHRLTFVQNTLTRLLDTGTQVVLTTFDNKLADWTQSNHDWRGLIAYELNLLDVVAGTEATRTSDTFSRLLLEAEENLHAPTARGRRAACGSYRSAAERLAKQIIATGRTHDGHPCTVGDVDAETSVLGDLVPLVSGYALDNAERGNWRTFAKVLNPGNHDDDVPSTTELKQVRGNLRKIANAHRTHWPNGLLL
jgi:AAA domain-containing protein